MGHPARRRSRPAGADARVAAAAPVSPSPMPACRARGSVPGALAATAQGICPRALANRAAGVTRTVALRPWSRPGAGRTPDGPVSEYGRVPGPGRARAAGPGVRSSRARWPGGKFQPPGSCPAARFTPPARSVTGWPKAIVASAGALPLFTFSVTSPPSASKEHSLQPRAQGGERRPVDPGQR